MSARRGAGRVDPAWDADALPAGPVVAGALVVAVAVLVHTLALTPLTNNLDDVKNATLMVGGALLLVVYAALAMKPWMRLVHPAVGGALAAWVGVMVLSTLVAAAPYATWLSWQTITTMVCAAGFFLGGTLFGSSLRLALWSVRFWIVVGAVTCAFGIVHDTGMLEKIEAGMRASATARVNAGGEAPALYLLVSTFAGQREMLSTILNTQFFGNFLLLVLPLALAGIVIETDIVRRRREANADPSGHDAWWLALSVVVALAATYCIFKTFSKICLLGIPIALVAFPTATHAMTRFKVLRIPQWPVAALLGALMVASVIAWSWGDLRMQMNRLETSRTSREVIWEGALGMFRESPLLGTGPGTFRLEFPRHRSPDYHLTAVSNLTLSAHNVVMDVLGETGVLGLAAFAAFLGSILWLAVTGLRRTPDHALRVMVIAYLVGVGLLYFGAMATPMIRWPIGIVTLYAALGMLTGLSHLAREGNVVPTMQPAAVASRRMMIAGGVGVAAVVWLVVMWGRSADFMAAAIENNNGRMKSSQALQVPSMPGLTPSQAISVQESILRQAADDFRTSVARHPTYLTAYYQLAHVQNRLGLAMQESVEATMREIEASGAMVTPEVRNDLKRQVIESNEYQLQALATYHKLREYAPDYAEVHLNTGIIYMNVSIRFRDLAMRYADNERERDEYLEQALDAARQSMEGYRRARGVSNKILVHYLTSTMAEQTARMLPTDSPERRALLVEAAEAAEFTAGLSLSHFKPEPGLLEEERRQREDAAARAPALYEQAGEWERAALAWERLAFEGSARTDSVLRAADAWRRAGNDDKIREVVEKGLARNPLNGELRLRRTQLLLRLAQEGGPREDAARDLAELIVLRERVPGFLDEERSRRLDGYLAEALAAGIVPPTILQDTPTTPTLAP